MADKARRVDTLVPKMFVEDNPAAPLGIPFCDEVHFHLNKQNTHVWASEHNGGTITPRTRNSGKN
jgi:hypothetical protein